MRVLSNVRKSTDTVMMLSMDPSIDSSVAVMFTARGPLFRWFSDCNLSSFGSKFLCGELGLSVSQYSSLSRSFPRSIAALLIFVHYDGVGVVPKGNRRQRKASLSIIAMQVDVVVVFAWIWPLAASRFVFPINIHFVGHLFFISDTMWSILRNQKS